MKKLQIAIVCCAFSFLNAPCADSARPLRRGGDDPCALYVRTVDTCGTLIREAFDKRERASASGNNDLRDSLDREIVLWSRAISQKRQRCYDVGLTNSATLSAEGRAIWEVARGVIEKLRGAGPGKEMAAKDPRLILQATEDEKAAIAKARKDYRDKTVKPTSPEGWTRHRRK